MSYVEDCKKHGYGEICEECFEEDGIQKLLLTERVTSLVSENLNLHEENTRLNDSIAVIYLENARLQAKNERLQEALKYIAFVGPDQCEDIRFGIENNCLAEVYKAEAERTLWEEK